MFYWCDLYGAICYVHYLQNEEKGKQYKVIDLEKWHDTVICYYLARAVTSPQPDLGKAVISNFVRTLPLLCPGMYRESHR